MPQRHTIAVDGMACPDCERTVERALSRLDGVRRPTADHETGEVDVVLDDTVDTAAIATAIRDAGYETETEA